MSRKLRQCSDLELKWPSSAEITRATMWGSVIRDKIELAEEYENIFEPNISQDLANNLQKTENLRRKED
jgi:hypothetical protein